MFSSLLNNYITKVVDSYLINFWSLKKMFKGVLNRTINGLLAEVRRSPNKSLASALCILLIRHRVPLFRIPVDFLLMHVKCGNKTSTTLDVYLTLHYALGKLNEVAMASPAIASMFLYNEKVTLAEYLISNGVFYNDPKYFQIKVSDGKSLAEYQIEHGWKPKTTKIKNLASKSILEHYRGKNVGMWNA